MKRTIEFDNGETFVYDEKNLELSINAQSDMTYAASRFSRACHYHALAKYELEVVDSKYRQWRATVAKENPGQCSSEPKAKSYLESLPEFLKWKERIATYQEVVDFLDGVKQSYNIKAQMIIAKSREANSAPNRTPTYSTGATRSRVAEYQDSVRRERHGEREYEDS